MKQSEGAGKKRWPSPPPRPRHRPLPVYKTRRRPAPPTHPPGPASASRSVPASMASHLPDADAAGFKLFGKVIQPPDAHHRAADEGGAPPQLPPPTTALPPPPPPPPSPPLPPQPPLPLQQQATGATGGTSGGGGEPLPCPRCGSRETKFCYFNNYNVRQPRHLCRACRRYWTAGGALRRVASASPGRRRPRPTTARSVAAAAAAAAAASSAAAAAAEEVGGERWLTRRSYRVQRGTARGVGLRLRFARRCGLPAFPRDAVTWCRAARPGGSQASVTGRPAGPPAGLRWGPAPRRPFHTN